MVLNKLAGMLVLNLVLLMQVPGSLYICFSSMLSFHVGDETRIRFLKDHWTGTLLLFNSFHDFIGYLLFIMFQFANF